MSDPKNEGTSSPTKTEIVASIIIVAYLVSLFVFLALPIIKEWF